VAVLILQEVKELELTREAAAIMAAEAKARKVPLHEVGSATAVAPLKAPSHAHTQVTCYSTSPQSSPSQCSEAINSVGGSSQRTPLLMFGQADVGNDPRLVVSPTARPQSNRTEQASSDITT
jgi:hypothetical protein